MRWEVLNDDFASFQIDAYMDDAVYAIECSGDMPHARAARHAGHAQSGRLDLVLGRWRLRHARITQLWKRHYRAEPIRIVLTAQGFVEGVGNFRHQPAKSRKGTDLLKLELREIAAISRRDIDPGWRVFCPYLGERSVFRAAVLSIVLTLAIGPNATLLCSVWCHPDEAQTSACQHQDATTSPRVTGEDSCRTVPASPTAFVREEAKRGSPTPISQQAMAVPLFRLGPPTHATRAYEATPSLDTATSPLLIALRI
jgi:hypothetical protein